MLFLGDEKDNALNENNEFEIGLLIAYIYAHAIFKYLTLSQFYFHFSCIGASLNEKLWTEEDIWQDPLLSLLWICLFENWSSHIEPTQGWGRGENNNRNGCQG